MKTKSTLLALAFLLLCPALQSAHAVLADWHPLEVPHRGPLGSGEHSIINGMNIYATPPSRPYIVTGAIEAGGGLFGSPRTRAVTKAKEVGADAIILVQAERWPTGGQAWGWGQGTNAGGGIGGFNYIQNYAVICHYQAIKWVKSRK
ncbi:hypothetical protein [Verrucomicrobium sp. 3C]|uniref:hypothetical protein n=1 Tax=Verrucomicrobium sp. 3C TaxID=1134055 RepID=UPI000365C776|nr:hypothetical protein [Verrucomicrobium sp. 3C]